MSNIGHNNPPSNIDEAIAEYSDSIEEAQGWLDGEPISDEAQLKATDALLKEIKGALKALNAARNAVTKPLHDAWKSEVARWKPTQDDLDLIIKGLISIQDPFKRALAAKKEAEKRAAWEAAEAARKEAEDAANAASSSDIEAQREVSAKAVEAQRALEDASLKQKDKVKGMRAVHRYEIESHREALHWIARNDRESVTEFVNSYVAKHHRDDKIDGVRTWTEREAF